MSVKYSSCDLKVLQIYIRIIEDYSLYKLLCEALDVNEVGSLLLICEDVHTVK